MKTTFYILQEKLSWSWNDRRRSCGPMDKASDYESGDCRFESCQDQHFAFCTYWHLFLIWFIECCVRLSEWWGANVCSITIANCVNECQGLCVCQICKAHRFGESLCTDFTPNPTWRSQEQVFRKKCLLIRARQCHRLSICSFHIWFDK